MQDFLWIQEPKFISFRSPAHSKLQPIHDYFSILKKNILALKISNDQTKQMTHCIIICNSLTLQQQKRIENNRPQTSTTNGTNTVSTTIIHHWMLAAKHMCVQFHSQESRFIEAAGTLHRVGGSQTDDFLSPSCRKIHWNHRLLKRTWQKVVGGGVYCA